MVTCSFSQYAVWRGAGQPFASPASPVSRLPGRERCSDVSANYLAGDHDFNPSILLTAGRRVVGSHRLRLAEALRRDRTHRHSLLGQVIAHGPAALFGEALIVDVPADAVRIAFYLQL